MKKRKKVSRDKEREREREGGKKKKGEKIREKVNKGMFERDMVTLKKKKK